MNLTETCPACGAPPWKVRVWLVPTFEGTEPAWRCKECGCRWPKGQRRLWLNLDERTLDSMPNDGWMGAAGMEVRGEHYEAYPHVWDWDLAWCRSRFAISSGLYHELANLRSPEGRDVLDIPAWIIRAALRMLPEADRIEEVW